MSYRFPLTACGGKYVSKLITTYLSWRLDYRLPLAALPRKYLMKAVVVSCVTLAGGRRIPALIDCGWNSADVFI